MDLIENDFKIEFETVCKILQNHNESYSYLDNKEIKDFKDIKNFINGDFLEFINNQPSINIIGLVKEFEKELDKFYMYAACSNLVNKTLVGIGGALNSGKSSFLNKLFSINILPSMITPATSVPTYVIQNENIKISLLNVFNNIIEIDETEIKNIYHEFEDTYNIPVGNILKSIFIQIPEQKYSNLAFLDTAGCSLIRKEDYNENNDYILMREHLNSCNYILWFVDSESGTIKESDIDFLESLKKDIPILVIISRVDKKQSSDMERIEKQVRMRLKKTGIAVLDIIQYSAKNVDKESMNKIEAYLKKWNENEVKCTTARNFQSIFYRLENYFYERRKKEKINLNTINSLLLNVEQVEDRNKIELIQEEIRHEINRIKQWEMELKKLNIEFLGLLKKAAELVGIDIYENLADNQNDKLIKFIRQYKKVNNIEERNYKGLINIRLYCSNNESLRNSSLFSEQNNSLIYKEIINKKISHISKSGLLENKNSIKNIIKVFSNSNINSEKKEKRNSLVIKHKVKKINAKDINFIKIKEI